MNIKHIGDSTNATKLIIKYSKCCSSRNRVLFFFLLEGQMNHRSNGFIVCGLNFWSQIRYHWDQKKFCAHLWENKTSERFFKKRYLQSLFALQYIIGWFLIFNIYLFKVTTLSQKQWPAKRSMILFFLCIFPADCKSLVLFSLRASALLAPSGTGHQSRTIPQAS